VLGGQAFGRLLASGLPGKIFGALLGDVLEGDLQAKEAPPRIFAPYGGIQARTARLVAKPLCSISCVLQPQMRYHVR